MVDDFHIIAVTVSTTAAARVAAAVAAAVDLHDGVATTASRTTCPTTVALGIDPEQLIDDEAALFEGGDGTSGIARTVVDTLLVRGHVMNEPATKLLTERGILSRVQDKGVPADIYQWRG